MHDLLCIDDAPNNVLDSTQIRKAEARKLAPTTTTSSIAGSRPVVVPSWLSIRGPSSSISTSTAWFQSTQEAKGIVFKEAFKVDREEVEFQQAGLQQT